MAKSTYYRRQRQAQRSRFPSRPRPKREAIRKQVREVALAFPSYGYRKVWAELLRQGIAAARSTVYRVLGEEGLLLSMRRRKTYQSRHQSQGQSKDQRPGPEPPRPEQVGLVLGADSTLWRLVEGKGAPSLGGYRILNVIEEESRYRLASVAGRAGEGESARLAYEAIARAREEAKRLGLPTKNLLLRTDRGPAFQAETFRAYLRKHQIEQVFAPAGNLKATARSSDCTGA